METPPGGWRGSIALDVVFLILDPDVIVAFDDDPDTVPDTVELRLPLLSLFPEVVAEAEPELDCDTVEDAWVDVDCAVGPVSHRWPAMRESTNLSLNLA